MYTSLLNSFARELVHRKLTHLFVFQRLHLGSERQSSLMPWRHYCCSCGQLPQKLLELLHGVVPSTAFSFPLLLWLRVTGAALAVPPCCCNLRQVRVFQLSSTLGARSLSLQLVVKSRLVQQAQDVEMKPELVVWFLGYAAKGCRAGAKCCVFVLLHGGQTNACQSAKCGGFTRGGCAEGSHTGGVRWGNFCRFVGPFDIFSILRPIPPNTAQFTFAIGPYVS